MNKLGKKPMTLEEITRLAENELAAKLPADYPVKHYVEDMNQLRKQIDCYVAEGKDYLDDGDYDMVALKFTDTVALQDVYDALKSGDLKTCRDRINYLETAVREDLPTRLYNKISC